MPVAQATLEWIKLRLPSGTTTLNRNGVTKPLDEAVEEALDENDGDRELALADILDILAASAVFDSETIGDYSYTGPQLKRRASELRGGGSFSFPPMRFDPSATLDEFGGD